MVGVTGGKLDLGETVQDCAVREIKEECNVLVESKLLKLVGVYSDPEEGKFCNILIIEFILLILFTYLKETILN